MLTLKRFVSAVVLVYLLVALLFLLVPALRRSVVDMGDSAQMEDFFRVLAWIGVGVLGLQLVVENLDSALLRRSVNSQDDKINELKAKLYDQQQKAAAALATVPAAPLTRFPESNVPPTPLA